VKSKIALFFAVIALTQFGVSCRTQPQQVDSPKPARGFLDVEYSQNTDTIPKYEIFEITFRHEANNPDPFFDINIDVVFTSPSKKEVHVGGFHYGASSVWGIWKARFAPLELGQWRYDFVFRNTHGQEARGEGTFTCIEGRKPNRGFVRLNPENQFRLVLDDGSPYFPIGLQDCWGDNSGTGSALDQCSMEGPFRTDRKEPWELPPGPMFVRGPSNNPQNADVYFRYFSQCGFNLYRFSQQNCSFGLNNDLNTYLVQQSVMTDEILCYARKYGYSICYGIFGFQKAFNKGPYDAESMSKVKRFIKYSVDRWGPYVDFWEFLNEQHADDR